MSIITIDENWEQVPGITDIDQTQEGWAFRLEGGRALPIRKIDGIGLHPIYGDGTDENFLGLVAVRELLYSGLATIWRPATNILDHEAFKGLARGDCHVNVRVRWLDVKIWEDGEVWIQNDHAGYIHPGDEKEFIDGVFAIKRTLKENK